MQQFAFDHLLRQFDQRIQDAEVALLHRNFEGLHVKPIAGQHTFGIPPLGVCSGTSSACLGFINDVVVNERCGVDDFYDRAQFDCAPALIIEKLGREQQQGRAQSLTAASAKILADLGDGRDTRDSIAPELSLDRRKIIAQ